MCSFLFTSKILSEQEIALSNRLLKFRGPDNTNIKQDENGTLIHNRLQIEGDCVQPYTRNSLTVLFNGEIYNYERSEVDYILDCYERCGNRFASYLDGEFAIVVLDVATKKILIASDTFKTKPIWYSCHDDGMHVSTYKNALVSLGCKEVVPLPANTVMIYDMDSKTCEFSLVTTFDLTQKKDNYTDFCNALDCAIAKRAKTDVKLFMGLSSGYDSGCIAAFLINQKIPFSAYIINNNENAEVLDGRKKLINEYEDITFSSGHGILASLHIKKYCELPEHTEYNYLEDASAKPLMHIGYRAKSNNCRVFLSGTGSDELYGDYYIAKTYEKDISTCFKGTYPDNLKTIFPWKNFFNGTMRKYLTKDECIMGSLGIETRYPFLDTKLVQEFLWLIPELKNAAYKAPLQQYLKKYNFPYCENEKLGFNV